MTDQQSQGRLQWRSGIGESFSALFWLLAVIATVLGIVCYFALGPEAFATAIANDRKLLAGLLPRLVAAQIIAGLVWELMPRERLMRLLGTGEGKHGLILAAAAGSATPGGPASAFAVLAVLASKGTERGLLIAYITSWALLGIQRIIVWQVPFMGLGFALLFFIVCLPLPLLAGAIARRLPISLSLVSHPTGSDKDPR